MAKNKVTTDELAVMIQHGFAETARKGDVDRRFDGVDKRLDAIEDKLESIEKLILADHKRRIERLEEQVKELRDLLAVK
jgi:archaellum component FlaC